MLLSKAIETEVYGCFSIINGDGNYLKIKSYVEIMLSKVARLLYVEAYISYTTSACFDSYCYVDFKKLQIGVEYDKNINCHD